MAILRNVNVAHKYKVTPATVGNWIEQAKNHRINLDLTMVKGKHYIEDTEHNHNELTRLKEQGVKYRSKAGGVVKIQPDPKIYEIFTEEQLISLFVNISYYNFIPIKFSYTDIGAKYYELGFNEAIKDPLNSSYIESKLVNDHFTSVVEKLSKDYKINFLEMGADSSTYAFKDSICKAIETKSLNKYISIGTSKEMHQIRSENISKWFNIHSKIYTLDIEENLVRNLLFKERDNDNTVNVCLLLLSSISNIRNISALLGNLYESLAKNDRLLISTILTDETGTDKIDPKIGENTGKRYQWLLDVLGLTKYISTHNYSYDPNQKLRSRYFVMDQDVEITFEIGDKKIPLLLERDRKITYFISYRYTLKDLITLFERTGFIVEQYNSSKDDKAGMFLLRSKAK